MGQFTKISGHKSPPSIRPEPFPSCDFQLHENQHVTVSSRLHAQEPLPAAAPGKAARRGRSRDVARRIEGGFFQRCRRMKRTAFRKQPKMSLF